MHPMILFLMVLISFGVNAEECRLDFNESEFIDSLGKEPVRVNSIKENGIIKKQYEFRKELSTEEAFSDDAESKYEPQFYLTLYQPPCTERVKIWFYKDNGNTQKLSNAVLAGRAFKYLSGVDEAIFENKMKKFSSVNSFESIDSKSDSKFLKIGDIYSIDVFLR